MKTFPNLLKSSVFIFIALYGANSFAGSLYIREKLLETDYGEKPYNWAPAILPNPFCGCDNEDWGIIDNFDILNDSNLVIFKEGDYLSVIQIPDGDITKQIFAGRLPKKIGRVGPQNRLYLFFSGGTITPDRTLRQYLFENNSFAVNKEFALPIYNDFKIKSIAPDGSLYINRGNPNGDRSRTDSIEVFGPDGKFVKESAALGKTSEGVEFLSKYSYIDKIFSCIDVNNGDTLFKLPESEYDGYCSFMIATYNNSIIVKSLKILSEEVEVYKANPKIYIYDLTAKTMESIIIEIPEEETYKYCYVPYINADYNGNIYAVAKCFNSSKDDDGKLILYKWHK